MVGANIETYLLEKSRVTSFLPNDRNYHIFYQLMSEGLSDLSEQLQIELDPSKYKFINQGKLTIESINDADEMITTKRALDSLGVTQEIQMDLFKATIAIAIFGNTEWKQRAKEDQAEPDGEPIELEKVAKLLGVDQEDLLKGLTKPKVKVRSA